MISTQNQKRFTHRHQPIQICKAVLSFSSTKKILNYHPFLYKFLEEQNTVLQRKAQKCQFFLRVVLSRCGPSKGHGCTHAHPITFAKQPNLVGIIHAYTLELDSDSNTNGMSGFGRTVSQSRKGRPRRGRTYGLG